MTPIDEHPARQRWAAAPDSDPAWPKLHLLVATREAGPYSEYRARCGFVFATSAEYPFRLALTGNSKELREEHPKHGPRACLRCRLPLPTAHGDPRRIGTTEILAAIRRIEHDEALLRELREIALAGGRNPDWPCNWGAGGCLILAESLRRALGRGELIGVSEDFAELDEEYSGGAAEHVAWQLRIDGQEWLVDIHGIHDGQRGLLESLAARGYSEPLLFPYKVSDHEEDEIPFDEGLVGRLETELRAGLGL